MDTVASQSICNSAGTWLQKHLARITSSNRFIPEIDGLRFIAISAVLLFHINGYLVVHGQSSITSQAAADPLNSVLQVLNYGVELFFVISGFILALPFAQQYINEAKPVSLKAYYLRRVTRIEPPYLIALFVWFAALVLAHKVPVSQLLPHLFVQIFYLNNIVFKTIPLICFVAWSLEIEVQFYITAPLLAKVF